MKQIIFLVPSIDESFRALCTLCVEATISTQTQHLWLTQHLKARFVEALDADSFVGLSALLALDLGHNRITSLGPGVFGDLASLELLVLDGNKITLVSSNKAQKMP